MRVTKFISPAFVVAVGLMSISIFAATQESAPTVKRVPIAHTPSNSGKAMFETYCAVCHGKDGKGDGPAASAMKIPPFDLTTRAEKWREISRFARVGSAQGTGPDRFAWQPGDASMGSALLRCQPGKSGPSPAADRQSGFLRRNPASEVADQAGCRNSMSPEAAIGVPTHPSQN